jgi:putative ABC transport system permease protein
LAVSLTVVIFIALWANDELSYDGFHRNASRIYCVNAKIGENQVWRASPAPLVLAAEEEIPGIEIACRIGNYNKVWEYDNRKFHSVKGAAVDTSFFSMFNFEIVKGNADKPFQDEVSMVLTESQAKTFFGDEDPIGKIVKSHDDILFNITAVVRDMPKNSSIRPDMLVPYSVQQRTFGGNGPWKTIDADWGSYQSGSYLKLAPDVDPAAVSDLLHDIAQRALRKDLGEGAIANRIDIRFPLQRIIDTHLYKPTGEPDGIKAVRMFGIIAVLVLLIACINYVNLVTARAARRSREISVKKIMGSSRAGLIAQLSLETVIVFVVALILSTILIVLLFPSYNAIADKEMTLDFLNPSVLMIYGATAVSVILLAGMYPAIFLSSFKPIDAFKRSAGKGGTYIRRTLVVAQFIVSFGLIVGTIVVSEQLNYMRVLDLGYDKENVFTLSPGRLSRHYDAARSEMLKHPDILGISTFSGQNMNPGGARGGKDWDGREDDNLPMLHYGFMYHDFLQTMNIPLVEGEYPKETDRNIVYLNEAAARVMNINQPVGKRFHMNAGDTTAFIIKGVFKNYNYEALSEAIKPMFLVVENRGWQSLYVKTTAAGARNAVAAVEKIWKEYNPDAEFNYTFLDDNFDKTYKADIRTGKLLTIFALIAIFVSCLGIFGLVTFTAETRTREIGIRKVLGAGVANIVVMLSREFIILVGIAMLISVPLSLMLLNKFLQSYAYRIDIAWWMFAAGALITTVLTLLTVSWKAIKAATANPVKAIKIE